jgi:hypothetical protein
MSKICLTASLLFVLLCAISEVSAQTVVSVNPEAVEFDAPSLTVSTPVNGYRVAFFLYGTDPRRDTPVKTVQIGTGARQDNGRVKISLQELVTDVPDGRYVATVQVIGPPDALPTPPSDPFVLSRNTSVQDRLDSARNERLWTRIAIGIAGALLTVPFLF